MNTITPGAARVTDAQANSEVITDALALQYAAPLPFGDADFQTLCALALDWENAGHATRSRKMRVLARHFADAIGGVVPFGFTICDVAEVYTAARLLRGLDVEHRRRAWTLATRMHRAIILRPLGDVIAEALGARYAITADGRAALAELTLALED